MRRWMVTGRWSKRSWTLERLAPYAPSDSARTSRSSRLSSHDVDNTSEPPAAPWSRTRGSIVTGQSEDGLALSMRYAVADIAVPLDSISQICDGGSVVVFSKKGGYVVNANGARLDFVRKGDTYRRRTWVRRPRQQHEKATKDKTGDVKMAWAEHVFPRPGQTTP